MLVFAGFGSGFAERFDHRWPRVVGRVTLEDSRVTWEDKRMAPTAKSNTRAAIYARVSTRNGITRLGDVSSVWVIYHLFG